MTRSAPVMLSVFAAVDIGRDQFHSVAGVVDEVLASWHHDERRVGVHHDEDVFVGVEVELQCAVLLPVVAGQIEFVPVFGQSLFLELHVQDWRKSVSRVFVHPVGGVEAVFVEDDDEVFAQVLVPECEQRWKYGLVKLR
eukprot:CAMPEP_0197036254 /NCGR_PEP_ID=MMETSP1384-20130603/13822_1 /TAXON_ID=29189 /ORGANISM="Ammonia sp." /LENGTH=138 /DNA_ID=CAMNT_0042466415 /DNA_START=171 /DNA_END=584 /DNA_ORIENTATION=-